MANARRQHGPVARTATVCAVEEAGAIRQVVALQAIWQADAMLAMLGREHGHESFDLVLESTLPRLKALMSVAMSVMGGDDHRETDEMKEVVHGCF